MAEHFFPEVAETLAHHGVEGVLHMLFARIKALEEQAGGPQRSASSPPESPAEESMPSPLAPPKSA